MPDADRARDMAFGQDGRITFVDRAGVWLSGHQIRRTVGSIDGKDVADFGCGFEATYMRSVLARVGSATLVDIALADDLKSLRNVTAIEGELPGVLAALPDQSLDVVLCMSVLEHLWEPGETLAHCRRMLRPGGICAINVPSWLGQPAVEFAAFRPGLSPPPVWAREGAPPHVLPPPRAVGGGGGGARARGGLYGLWCRPSPGVDR